MVSDREIDDFLSSHGPFVTPPRFGNGDEFGEWRITASLGRGGSSEVYRAVHGRLGTVVAIKVLVRLTEASRVRFAEKARLLSLSLGTAFPRFYGYAERGGFPYIVEECLDPFELPQRDRDVAAYVLRLCEGVGVLHARGLVHRDLKPQNIMRRLEDGAPVLIDLGLVKNAEAGSATGRESVSIVEGRSVAVGTPGFSAPEQFTGGDVTPATDVHALGAIANVCFGGRPPLFWRGIIHKATSSIPGQRYRTAEALACAIRSRYRICIVAGLVLAGVVIAAAVGVLLAMQKNAMVVADAKNVEISQEDQKKPLMQAERAVSPDMDAVLELMKEEMLGIERRDYRREVLESTWEDAAEATVVNGCRILKVRLLDRIVKVRDRVEVAGPARIYVIGPGSLDVDLSGGTNVCVEILNRGVLLNRTTHSYPESGIRYSIRDESYLNFVNLDWPKGGFSPRVTVEKEMSMLDYRGPTVYREAQIKRFKFLEKTMQEDDEKRIKARIQNATREF